MLEVTRSSSFLLALSLLALACGPMGPMPGGELSGNISPAPADWSTVAEDTVQLETRPGDPYSVNLWGVGIDTGYYIAAGRGAEAEWVEHIRAEPNVRLGVGEKVYELRATRITDQTELDRFVVALRAKYDFEVSPEQKERAWVFRLDPR
jgi:hypothetical protein